MLRKLNVQWRAILVVALVAILMATSALTGFAATVTTTQQPAVASPGIQAPDMERVYRAGQTAHDTTEEARVRSAVDNYFKLKYESWARKQALDPGFVIERSTLAGRDLYNYELGRLKYTLDCWQQTKNLYRSLHLPSYV
jgi:hypothetical protein